MFYRREVVCCTYSLTLEENRSLGCFPLRWGVDPGFMQSKTYAVLEFLFEGKKDQTIDFYKLYKNIWSYEHIGKVPSQGQGKIKWGAPLGLSLVTFTANSLLAKCILLWKLLRRLHFPKFMKRLFGFDPWGQVIL